MSGPRYQHDYPDQSLVLSRYLDRENRWYPSWKKIIWAWIKFSWFKHWLRKAFNPMKFFSKKANFWFRKNPKVNPKFSNPIHSSVINHQNLPKFLTPCWNETTSLKRKGITILKSEGSEKLTGQQFSRVRSRKIQVLRIHQIKERKASLRLPISVKQI